MLFIQSPRGHHPQRSEARPEPAEEDLQHLRLRGHQGGPQETLPAAGELNASLVQTSEHLIWFICGFMFGFFFLSADGRGSLLSRRQELPVSLPEGRSEQSLPKVLLLKSHFSFYFIFLIKNVFLAQNYIFHNFCTKTLNVAQLNICKKKGLYL